jgi:hypothetical protein
MIVLLDAGPLGLVTNPRGKPESQLCKQWLANMAASGVPVRVPEIADFEVRRELLRVGSVRGIAHLDQLKVTAGYVPITTEAMLQAAVFWAQARRQGRPTAPDLALDADVILAGQAFVLAAQEGDRVIIATTNVGHLSRFADADLWQNITAPTP